MIVIDAGNSRVVCARSDGTEIAAVAEVDAVTAIAQQQILALLQGIVIADDDSIVVSSVNIRLDKLLQQELSGRKVLIVNRQTDFGITNRYQSTETLGLDRLVNASAACHLYGGDGRPSVVADLGTATSVDYISGQGEFLGGVIAPGIRSGYDGLLLNAPHLPRIELVSDGILIGRQTAECLRSGLICGHAAMIRGLFERMAAVMATKPLLLVTGGFCELVAAELGHDAVIDPQLTLKGLIRIGQLAGINLAKLT